MYARYGKRYVRTSYCVAEVNAISLVSYLYARVGATGLLTFGLSFPPAFQRQAHKNGIGPGCEYTSCACAYVCVRDCGRVCVCFRVMYKCESRRKSFFGWTASRTKTWEKCGQRKRLLRCPRVVL